MGTPVAMMFVCSFNTLTKMTEPSLGGVDSKVNFERTDSAWKDMSKILYISVHADSLLDFQVGDSSFYRKITCVQAMEAF